MLFLAGPHQSLLDGPRLAWHLRKYRICWAIDAEWATHPFWRVALRVYGALLGHAFVPLSPKNPQSLRALLRVLRAGGHVALFPEGTIHGVERIPDGWWWLARRSGADAVMVGMGKRIRIVRVVRHQDLAQDHLAWILPAEERTDIRLHPVDHVE